MLTALYDAIHAAALTTTGASEHLSNAATTAQLSSRFAQSKAGVPALLQPLWRPSTATAVLGAATMKSIDNLLLLGDGEDRLRRPAQLTTCLGEIARKRFMGGKRIDLDARSWRTVLDFYKALLAQIEAPDWHGTSVAALVDSMIYGGINNLEPPYTVYVRGLMTSPSEIKAEVLAFKSAIDAARAERRTVTGIDVPVAVEIV